MSSNKHYMGEIMDPFEKWRREVNIILHDTVGYSLADLAEYIEENVRRLYEDGEDPLDGAQYVAGEIDPSLDLEEIIADRLAPKVKSTSKKNLKKFKVIDEGF
jgi:hypothetical protein